MFVPFSTISNDARVWIYQASRKITPEEYQSIVTKGRQFIDNWGTHGQPLTASIEVLEDYFLIISVDDYLQLPSGCSIDASVSFIRSIGEELQINFFDRSLVPLWKNESIVMVPLTELKQQMKEGKIDSDTTLMNTLVEKKSELANWLIPIKSSWLGRYLPQATSN